MTLLCVKVLGCDCH